MSILNDSNHKKRIKKLQYEFNLNSNIISKIIDLSFDFIRLKITTKKNKEIIVPDDKLLTKEEFDNLLPTIRVPLLGYFKPNYYKYKRIYLNRIKKLNNKNIK